MIRVFVTCSGLGRTHRGYETAFRAIHDVLVGEPGIELHLFKGGGPPSATETSLWNLPRVSASATRIGAIARLGNPLLGRGYLVEQLTFFVSLIPHLIARQPDLIYFSDKDLGRFLAKWRRISGQRFRLLFRNGGPYPPPYPRFDHVQQVTGPLLEQSLAAGSPPSQLSLLPEGFNIAAEFTPIHSEEATALRRRLSLPGERQIVLSVSAVNNSHKRLGYLIDELAALPAPRPFLLVLGQTDAETPGVLRHAETRLGMEHFAIRSVAPDAVSDYYRASNLLVLASTREGFGRVMVEALAQGLPCLVHDYAITRFVLGSHGYFSDFTAQGALARLLRDVLAEGFQPERQAARHRSAYERFSWDVLREDYLNLLRRCASSRGTTGA